MNIRHYSIGLSDSTQLSYSCANTHRSKKSPHRWVKKRIPPVSHHGNTVEIDLILVVTYQLQSQARASSNKEKVGPSDKKQSFTTAVPVFVVGKKQGNDFKIA